ncbi:hypothetical protein F2Q70_00036129 [Brassica cretica]|uniref:Uncharacterized protein n=1 Tax=Brassica cretica TaxID=69181 RepID=A0A8S9JPN1_BRACR|nr:hypothetical protein F2Q70_00036129 [Brassica cretica]
MSEEAEADLRHNQFKSLVLGLGIQWIGFLLQRDLEISCDPTILTQRDDHTKLEARARAENMEMPQMWLQHCRGDGGVLRSWFKCDLEHFGDSGAKWNLKGRKPVAVQKGET